MPTTPKQRVFSALEVAKFCGVVNQTVINWIRAGHLPASTTPGGQFRIYPDDLKTFLDSKGMKVPLEVQNLVEPPVPSILVVEDDMVYNDLLRAQLARVFPDVKIMAAYDGFEAGTLLGRHRPRVVVLDLNLPGVDGLELCRRVKQDEVFENPYVVGITAWTDPEWESRILALGANTFLRKPFEPEVLIESIRTALKR